MFPYLSLSSIVIGAITIQVWGFFVAVGVFAALTVSLKEAHKADISDEVIWDVIILAFLGMIVGGRIFYILSNPGKNLAVLIDVHGGFSFTGGAILAGTLSLFYLKSKKQDFRKVFDLLAPGFIVALISTRVGCFLISDHIGRITTLPWGMEFADGSFRHPVTLYEIIFLIFMLGAVYKLKAKPKRDGYIFMTFFIAYAVFRLGVDFLRCDDLSVCDVRFYGMTATQWVLSWCVLISLILYTWRGWEIRRRKT
ncbi:MAG: prolipoprotein diacylglyceryl transferase [Candidatus Pacebacteria bacterium]|nr:prolipoprotein diacylglyceryl transferase [Candidatus Paceibacterota bacterium]